MPLTLGDVDRIRRFNRFYVQRMGLYARDYLRTGHSVTDWRLLAETDSPDRRRRGRSPNGWNWTRAM